MRVHQRKASAQLAAGCIQVMLVHASESRCTSISHTYWLKGAEASA